MVGLSILKWVPSTAVDVGSTPTVMVTGAVISFDVGPINFTFSSNSFSTPSAMAAKTARLCSKLAKSMLNPKPSCWPMQQDRI